jgi:hypothetical protein
MLSNIYRQNRSLMQIFLVGQPGLRRKLASAGLEQLRQRIVAIYHLTPLNEVEARQYILHRLRTVGWQNDPRLADDCFPAIYRETRGVPRLINNLCDRLLWHAFVEENHAIGEQDVELVVQDMRLDAEGMTADLSLDPGFVGPSAETAEADVRPLKQATTASDRVIDFRNPVEREK